MKRTLKDLLLILPQIENFETWAESLPYPETVGGHAVQKPDELTLSQYLELSEIQVGENVLLATTQIMIAGKPSYEEICDFEADAVVGLVWGVKKAVETLNEAFQSISPELTDEEKRAMPPAFGVMGLIDYASRRFGKTYDEAEKLNVWHVFEALKIENETAEYRKRLQEIYRNKNK